jgi:catabolite regulation protein CreA
MVYGTENEEIGNVDFVVDSVVQDMFIKSMKMSKVKDIHQRITLYKEINDQYFCIFDDLKEAEEVENAEG